MTNLTIGIDASRNRSGGAIDHIIGLLTHAQPLEYGIAKVHLWSFKRLLDQVPDAPWLVKHNPQELEKSLPHQIWWQLRRLPGELRDCGCDILFASDASTCSSFAPMVAFSQDALSYEPGIMQTFGLTKARLRLIAIKILQNRALRHACGVIFLTRYAAQLIQTSTGKLGRVAVIAHGIDNIFRQRPARKPWPDGSVPIRCVYVSNAAMYKNQWVVIRAVKKLRDRGYNIELCLAGGGRGPATKLVEDAIAVADPEGLFVRCLGFVEHDNLPDLLASSDIFLFASSCETISITLLEGMAAGMPIACSNKGPMPEVLQDGGVYFEPTDADSIAAALERIIVDADLRVTIADRASTRSSDFSWDRCSAETWQFLRDCALATNNNKSEGKV